MDLNIILAIHFIILLIIFSINHFKIFSERTRFFLLGLGIFEGLNSFLKLGSYLPSLFGFLALVFFSYIISRELEKLEIQKDPKFIRVDNRILFFFPYAGFLGLFLVYLYNLEYSNSNYGSNDFISIIFCLILILYTKINFLNPYIVNFSFISLFIANMILVLPRLANLILEGSINDNFDDEVVYLFLNIPLNKVLTLLGYNVFSDSSILKFYTTSSSLEAVNIGRTCSGLHSVAIFISAFTAYSYLEKYKFDFNTIVFTILGIIISYFANLLRMLIIVLVGIHMDFETMIWVHEHLGWLIFTSWIFLFWKLYDNYSFDIQLIK